MLAGAPGLSTMELSPGARVVEDAGAARRTGGASGRLQVCFS